MASKKFVKEKQRRTEIYEPEDEKIPIDNEDVWHPIHLFYEENGLVSGQINSYNDFIHNLSHKIMREFKYLEIEEKGIKHKVEFGDLFFDTPKIIELEDTISDVYPTMAKHRKINYSSDISCNITITTQSGVEKRYKKINLGSIPVMVGSDLCNMKKIRHDREAMAKYNEDFRETGGYFIIVSKNENNQDCIAHEKILIPQERTAQNKVYVFGNRKQKPHYQMYAEIRSTNSIAHTTLCVVGIIDDIITCLLPWIDSAEIPIGVLFYALGVTDPKKIAMIIFGKNWEEYEMECDILTLSLESSISIQTQTDALVYIGKRGKKFVKEESTDNTEIMSYAKHLLSSEYLPHIGKGFESFEEKAEYTGYMVKKLLDTFMGKRLLESRDHYMNKRVITVGALFAQQFHLAMRKLTMEIVNTTKSAISKGNVVNIISNIKPSVITNTMISFINVNKGKGASTASQAFEKYNYAAGIANLRKITVPIAAETGKVIEPRDLHPTHWGVICPSETPEGKKTGLVKNQAMMTYITSNVDPIPIIEFIKNLPEIDSEKLLETLNWVRIFVNGKPVGKTNKPHEVINKIVASRRSGNMSFETSVAYDEKYKEINVSTDYGRLCRPLFIVENQKLLFTKDHLEKIRTKKITWTQLLSMGVIDYIDQAESERCLIAYYPEQLVGKNFTHCEMHPSLIYGIGGSIIPFPDHNQSPRNTYQSAMGKQAVGIPFTNYRQIMNGTFHTLQYLQRPLALSRSARIIGYDKMPSGQNAMIAIMPRPNNEEDSIEINKHSIDRGFMISYKWICYYAEKKDDKMDLFTIPREEDCDKFQGNSSKLCEEGFVKPGTVVEEGDILIGRVTIKESSKKKFVNDSILYDQVLPGVVDMVKIGVNGDGYPYIRVMVTQKREPIIGDKFSAMHGQKGIVGSKVSSENFPFTQSGMTPDIIINTLALPSRMTIAMLIEVLCGKVVCSTSPLHKFELNKRGTEKAFPKERLNYREGYEEEIDENEYESNLSEEFKKMFIHPEDGLIDSTPFRNFDREVIKKEMSKYGLECGEELMIDGETGCPLQCLVFFGPAFYQRLKHQVVDKIHARPKGPRTALTRQPSEGRASKGGLKCGSMERDCIHGQGATRIARDRLATQSDPFYMYQCEICGLPAHIERKEDGSITKRCNVCEVGSDRIKKIFIPYGTKLASQELMTDNIVPRIIV